MLARSIATVRADRRLQVGGGLLAITAGAFLWWTLSPFFIRPTLVETTIEATIRVAPATPATSAVAPADASSAPAPTAPVARLLARGELQRLDAVHAGTGRVVVLELDGKLVLRFQDVSILNGPDLHVYLARRSGGVHDVDNDLDLGRLKAPNGTFTYEIPAGTDLRGYPSVVVWCNVFRVVFTYADLTTA